MLLQASLAGRGLQLTSGVLVRSAAVEYHHPRWACLPQGGLHHLDRSFSSGSRRRSDWRQQLALVQLSSSR
jgi:hypothetical protein